MPRRKVGYRHRRLTSVTHGHWSVRPTGVSVTCRLSIIANGRLPGMPSLPKAHSAQAQVRSHQCGQYERVRYPHGAATQVSNDEQHVNRPDERCHEAAESNQGTQPRRVVVLAELRLLPLPPGNLFIRAIFLGLNQKWRQHGNALLGHLPCHYPALHAVCAAASPTAGRVPLKSRAGLAWSRRDATKGSALDGLRETSTVPRHSTGWRP